MRFRIHKLAELLIITDASWREDLRKGSWGALVQLQNPSEERLYSDKLGSCVSNGQAEILGAERILFQMKNLPKGTRITLATDYLLTARQAQTDFPKAVQDTPEGRALRDLQKRVLQLERKKIRVFILRPDMDDKAMQAAFQRVHNAARRELQLEKQRRTSPRKRRQLPKTPPGTEPKKS